MRKLPPLTLPYTASAATGSGEDSGDVTDLAIAYEEAWRTAEAGRAPRFEPFLEQSDAAERKETLRALLEVEKELRRAAGEAPAWGDYKDRVAEDDFMVLADLGLTCTDADGPLGFVLRRELGRGGAGVVWFAFELELKRWVALRRPLPSESADHLDRFRNEPLAVSKVQHPNIVQVFHVDEHQGLPFFTMEHLPGRSLADRLTIAPLPPEESARLVRSLAEAMAAAHGKDLIHRDLKPANVLFATDGTPKVTDFGLASSTDTFRTTTRGLVSFAARRAT